MLLSFEQFEREVIGERIHDKMAASKRKAVKRVMRGDVRFVYRLAGDCSRLPVLFHCCCIPRVVFGEHVPLSHARRLAFAAGESHGLPSSS